VAMWFVKNCSKELPNDAVSDTTEADGRNAVGLIKFNL
jgi:hypothetical protein